MNLDQIYQLLEIGIESIDVRYGTRTAGDEKQTGWWYLLGWVDPKSPPGTMPSGLFLGETWEEAISKLQEWNAN